MPPFPTIVKLETFIPSGKGSGGDYHDQKSGHWIIDSTSCVFCNGDPF
jgi:L-rhamnonate dehydratase